MAGIATLSSALGMTPETYTYQLDPANATTGLCLNWRNDTGMTQIVQVGFYVVTQASAGQLFDIGVTTTSGAQATTIADGSSAGGTGTSGSVIWSDGNDVIADGSYLTIFNVATSTPAAATALVAYAVIKTWPVCLVV